MRKTRLTFDALEEDATGSMTDEASLVSILLEPGPNDGFVVVADATKAPNVGTSSTRETLLFVFFIFISIFTNYGTNLSTNQLNV